MTGPLDCAQVERRLWEYLDGALPPEEAAAIRIHLAGCAGCGPVCRCARALLAAVCRAGLAAGGAPPGLRTRVLGFLADEP